jgi:hypothetical protein
MLEIGGIAWHLRTMVRHWTTAVLFQIFYEPSRILLLFNLLRSTNFYYAIDILIFLVGTSLIALNTMWWYKATFK